MRRCFINLPDADLAYFPEGTRAFRRLLSRRSAGRSDFAMENRRVMMRHAVEALRGAIPKPFEARSGSGQLPSQLRRARRRISARTCSSRARARCARAEGVMGIIPGSMGAKSFIVRGRGNAESFCSCSHGAGRVMSRTEAKRRFTVADHSPRRPASNAARTRT